MPHPVKQGLTPIAGVLVLVLCSGLLTAPASAVEFNVGQVRGGIDTTVSQGLSIRIQKPDSKLAADTNGNDGNLNYRRGVISNTTKLTTDLSLDVGDFGAFARITGFLDMENQDGTRARTPLSEDAKRAAGRDIELLDFYATWGTDFGDTGIDLRLGKHVLNWGESAFIQAGINVINPLDASKLRLPGAELREGLLPVSMVSTTITPTDTVEVEGFYQFEWEPTRVDPVGTYFSTVDYVGPGAYKAVIPLPGLKVTDEGFSPNSKIGFEPLIGLINADLTGQQPVAFPDPDFLSVRRTADRNPGNSGQYGFAARLLAEDLGDTEFGAYFVRYHSRLPLVSGRTPATPTILASLGIAQALSSPRSRTLAAVTKLVTQQVTAAVRAGQIPPAAAPTAIRTKVGEQMQGIASALAINRYGKDTRYFVEYPKDLSLFGLSFNTRLGATGWALQGEYSYRPDAPLQRAERAIFAEGLAPVVTALQIAGDKAALGRHLASHRPRDVRGYVERDLSQWQATLSKFFGPTLGASTLVFVAEAAVMHVHEMPDKKVSPLESPAGGVSEDNEDADATSLGYRLYAQLDYNNAIGALNLSPYAQLQHDVQGNSPSPSGQFAEGRMAMTVGLKADYLSQLEFNIGATFYWGDTNELSDRDYVFTSVKYSF